jgi:hypothetical protein
MESDPIYCVIRVQAKMTMTTSTASPSIGALFRAQMLGDGCCGLCWVVHLGDGWLLCLRSVAMVSYWKLVKLVVESCESVELTGYGKRGQLHRLLNSNINSVTDVGLDETSPLTYRAYRLFLPSPRRDLL